MPEATNMNITQGTTTTGIGVAPVIQAPTPAPAQAAPKAEDIAASLIAALETRTQRAERSVAKSFSDQYGLSEGEINAILAKAKADKDAQIPEAAQAAINKQNELVNKKLITAEVKAQGADLGLLDVDTAMLLLDTQNVKVADNGDVTGVKEALAALAESKPFLFRAAGQQGGAAGSQQNAGNAAGAQQGGVRISTGASLAGGKVYTSKDDIMAIKDPVERQRAIAENMALFRPQKNN